MQREAPAKINLTLEVLDRRADGYHGVRSVMVPLDLCDELSIEPSDRGGFFCDDPALENDGNLAVRALQRVAPRARVTIRLQKRIPTQAGLGGGSSDAAAILLAAMDGAFGPPAAMDWMAAARALGSDVPFFLARSGALVEGTGERVTALGSLPPWHVLVIKPPAAISTAAAYAELDRTPRPSRPRNASVSLQMVAAVQRAQFQNVCALLSNDFEEPIARTTPEVAQALTALRACGAPALLSGSGSALFALGRDAASIATLDERLDLPASFARFRTRFRNEGAWRP